MFHNELVFQLCLRDLTLFLRGIGTTEIRLHCNTYRKQATVCLLHFVAYEPHQSSSESDPACAVFLLLCHFETV